MSITRCKHCDNQYDQDTDVEHEDMCAEEVEKTLSVDLKLSDIQKKAIKEKCPHCEQGELHEVPNPDDTEMYLWCNNCDLSMDSSGGYTI